MERKNDSAQSVGVLLCVYVLQLLIASRCHLRVQAMALSVRECRALCSGPIYPEPGSSVRMRVSHLILDHASSGHRAWTGNIRVGISALGLPTSSFVLLCLMHKRYYPITSLTAIQRLFTRWGSDLGPTQRQAPIYKLAGLQTEQEARRSSLDNLVTLRL